MSLGQNTSNTITTKPKSKQYFLPEPGIEPPNPLNLSIVVKLFYCFNVTGRNINKQFQVYGPRFFNKGV